MEFWIIIFSFAIEIVNLFLLYLLILIGGYGKIQHYRKEGKRGCLQKPCQSSAHGWAKRENPGFDTDTKEVQRQGLFCKKACRGFRDQHPVHLSCCQRALSHELHLVCQQV